MTIITFKIKELNAKTKLNNPKLAKIYLSHPNILSTKLTHQVDYFIQIQHKISTPNPEHKHSTIHHQPDKDKRNKTV